MDAKKDVDDAKKGEPLLRWPTARVRETATAPAGAHRASPPPSHAAQPVAKAPGSGPDPARLAAARAVTLLEASSAGAPAAPSPAPGPLG